MDYPRRHGGDTDAEGTAAYEQAARFRSALSEEIQRLDTEHGRLQDELVEHREHGHRRRAEVTERALREIDAERTAVHRMLSELHRRFPEG